MQLKAAIGDYFDTSYEIELIGGKIKYRSCNELLDIRGQKTIHPNALAWSQFRKTLDQINIWQWRAMYSNPPGILGGIVWSIDICYEGHQLLSNGSNHYPGEPGKYTDAFMKTRCFKRFLRAVEQLIGERFQ